MIPRRLGACLVVALAVLAGCAAPGPLPPVLRWNDAGGYRPAPRTPDVAPTPRWSVDLPAGSPGASVDGDVVVIGSQGGSPTRVERIDPASGRPLWDVPTDGPDGNPLVRGPAARPAVVVESTGTDGVVTVLDAADGRTEWRGPEQDTVTVDVTADLLLVESYDGTTAVDRTTGAQRWRSPSSISARPGGLLVDDLPTSTRPTPVRGVVDPATGAARWTREDPPRSAVDLLDGVLVTVAATGTGTTVTASDPATGAPRWTVPTSGLRGAVSGLGGRAKVRAIDPDRLLVAGEDGGAVALAAADGREQWSSAGELAFTPLVQVAGNPVVMRFDGGVSRDLDGRTGRERETSLASYEGVGTALYSQDGDDVVATGVDDLEERWRVAVPGLDRLDPVPGGFVALTGRGGGPRRLVGYLG